MVLYMKVAALYDIHANLPALDAILKEIESVNVELIVCGGDCAAGPMPGETIDRLANLGVPSRFVMGNADRAMIEDYDSKSRPEDTTNASESGPRWSARHISGSQRDFLAAFKPTVAVNVPVLGSVLFCHGSPRSDTEVITAVTPEDRLAAMLDAVTEDIVVCGHTHRQFQLQARGKRVLNAGSVGMPYEGAAAAFWLMLGEGIDMRRTTYDVESALQAFRTTGYPNVDEMLKESLIEPADPDEVSRYFERSATGAERD
jgi:predicted phosphodiesterase